MYLLNKNTIYDLPIHDSDLLDLNISQNDEGDTELRLKIAFYADEVHLLDKHIIELLGSNNEADLLMNNCSLINLNGHYNCASRDQFDYIEFIQEPSIIEQNEIKSSDYHIKIAFISGSTLECIYEEVGLDSCKK